MILPPLFELGYHSILYMCFGYIVCMGLWQSYVIHVTNEQFKKSFVPLGAAAVAVGFILQIIEQIKVFDAIAAAGDISPALIAGGIKGSLHYPLLGLFSLATAYLLKYFNQNG